MEIIQECIAWLVQAFQVLTHLDVYLNQWILQFGGWIYLILFLIIFCETGLVVTPLLPGDSLLFALGALAAGENAALSLPYLLVLLFVAGVLGDAVNYAIGNRFGNRFFKSETSKLFNKKHLQKTQEFYAKYGGKTVIIARFIPIVRTFAPFVAGMGSMSYSRFALFNVVGAALWVGSFLVAGFFFGNIPAVKTNFHYVIFGIIIVSILPPVFEYWRARRTATSRSTLHDGLH